MDEVEQDVSGFTPVYAAAQVNKSELELRFEPL